MNNSDHIFSVVIPVYNSEKTLIQLYERIVKTMEENEKRFEIIFVEDCGPDNAWDVLRLLANQDQRVTAIQLMRNYGQAGATMCGLRQAVGDYVITIDDDLQNPPEEIQVVIDAILQNPELDVVMGIPEQKQHSLWRRLGSNVLNCFNRRMFSKSNDFKLSSFRIIKRNVVNQLLSLRAPRPAPGPMLCMITPRIGNVTVEHHPREVGKGNYTIAKIVGTTLDKFLGFSTYPLRMLAFMGLIGITGSILLGAFYITRFIMGGIGVPGWITQILLLIALSGFNFFAFGILGEYLLRILQSVHGMPQYMIRHKVCEVNSDHHRKLK